MRWLGNGEDLLLTSEQLQPVIDGGDADCEIRRWFRVRLNLAQRVNETGAVCVGDVCLHPKVF